MKFFKSKKNFNNIEFSHTLSNSSMSSQNSKKFSSWIVIHNKYKIVFRLKAPMKMSMKRMTHLNHNVSLILYQPLFFVFLDKCFAYDFHGVEHTVSFESGNEHFRKSTLTNALENVKGFDVNGGLRSDKVGFQVHCFSIERIGFTIGKTEIVVKCKIIIKTFQNKILRILFSNICLFYFLH